MPHIAGLVASDGHMSKNSYKIKIVSTNKKFVDAIRQELSNLGFKSGLYKGKTGYEVYLYNKKLWQILLIQYKIPPGKKAYDLEIPENLSTEAEIEYLRGLLDGDSSIFETTTVLRRPNKVYRYFVPRIEFKSKSRSVIVWSLNILRKYGMKPYIQKDPNFHRWFLDGCSNIRKFENIGFGHPEKQEKMKLILDLYHNYRYYRHFPAG